VVIDHRVHVVIPDTAVTDLFAAPMSTPSAPVRNAAELLDIDMDQFARTTPLIAHRGGLRRLNHHTGHRIAVTQVGLTAPTKNPPDSTSSDTQLRA
jgi:hypothetical protein